MQCIKRLEEKRLKVMTQIKEDEVIQRAVNRAIREYDKKQKEEQKQKVLHDTKLLMKHYNSLRIHADNAIDNIDALEEDFKDEDIRDKTYILSIRRTKMRTVIMISHIEMAMEEVRKKKLKEGTYEQYKAFRMYYIDKKSYDDIQKELNCSKNTPARWINSTIRDISILLFGIDGLKFNWLG